MLVDLAALPREQPNVAGLIEALQARGIRIIGTEGAHPSWEGIEKWGAPLSGSRPGRAVELPGRPLRPLRLPLRRSAPGAAPASGSLIVEQPVRSGQSVVFEAGDVTVWVRSRPARRSMAGGSIHVYGTLRGRAVAGLAGNAARANFLPPPRSRAAGDRRPLSDRRRRWSPACAAGPCRRGLMARR